MFTIHIEYHYTDTNEISEDAHYFIFGNQGIQIDNKKLDFTAENDNIELEKFHMALITARTKYMLDVITELEKKEEKLFLNTNIGKWRSYDMPKDIFTFISKSKNLKKSMKSICTLSFNNAYMYFYQNFVDKNMPTLDFNNTEEEEEA